MTNNRGDSGRRFSRGKMIVHLILFLSSIILVVALYPREGKFWYEYQKGKPWLHESLMAPWDFPVLKSEAEVKRERDSLLANFAPYFDYDSVMAHKSSDQFLAHVDELAMDIRENHYDYWDRSFYEELRDELLLELTEIYDRGVLDSGSATEGIVAGSDRVTVVRGRVATELPLERVYTHKGAYDALNSTRNRMAESVETDYGGFYSELLRRVDLYSILQPNLTYNEERSRGAREALLRTLIPTRGLVQERELIINRGEIVNQQNYQVIESLRSDYEERLGRYGTLSVTIGKFILVVSCYFILYLFLYHFRPEVLDSLLKTVFIILLVLLFTGATRFVVSVPALNVYLIPFGLIAIVIRTFYDSRLALFILLITIMLAGFMVPNSFEFVFLTFIAGVIAIFSLTNTYRRGRLFFTSLMVAISYSVVYSGIGIIQEGSIVDINYVNYGWFAVNGVLLLMVFPITFIFEKAFGFLSDATLFELSDTNQPLLRRLAEEAPGSFQHSLQVANLAAEAAQAIGGNDLLVRVGALYHDIGKMVKPQFFTENSSSNFDPHKELSPEESAKMIIDHIEKGVELAKKYNLPSQIIDFIVTHQGTTTAYYFYHKHLEANAGKDVDDSLFTYPGPKPFSKETAVLMMADAVEAASRSLPGYSKESIGQVVESVIDNQLADGQFSDSPITLKDISVVKAVLKNRLSNIYHARIAYPARK